MLIALDYDGTYTMDRGMWNAFILTAQRCGHEVVCITMRHEHEPVNDLPKGVMVYYTGRKAKGLWAEANKLRPHIWIDDQPNWILHDSA